MKQLAYISVLALLIGCGPDDPEPTPPTPQVPELHIPENWTGNWETVDPADLNWNTAAIDDLYGFLDSSDTRALLVLYYGRIAIEYYNGEQLNGQPFNRLSNWYWASAGKTLTAVAAGVASDRGDLDLEASASDYLGAGWTSATSSQEQAIKVRYQLSMTSGLDDGVSNPDCIDPSCFQYLAEPGTRWAYHNGVYTKLHDVIGSATGTSFEEYVQNEVTGKIGIGGSWFWLGDNRVFFSSARSMARFGILHLNDGMWGEDTIISKTTLETLINPSQSINPSYGYLYWLNGGSSFQLPGSQISFNGSLIPNAPGDMYSAIGKNSQILSIIPSEGLIIVRMGEEPLGSLVPIDYHRDLWDRLDKVFNP